VNHALCVILGLITGAAMGVAVSCVWVVLKIPARLQDLFCLTSSRPCLISLWAGLQFSALSLLPGFSLPLPLMAGSAVILSAGMFVGMIATALGEILEVVPVLCRRFHLADFSVPARWVLVLAKGAGAVIACLTFPP